MEILKKVNNVEKKLKEKGKEKPEAKTYAEITKEIGTSNVVPDNSLQTSNSCVTVVNTKMKEPTNIPPQTIVNVQGSVHDNLDINLEQNIPVVCSRDVNMVTNRSDDSKGYTRNRVDRYFVSGIRKSSTESGMRNYLEEQNVHVTFIRYFSNPNSVTDSAQLNVVCENSNIIQNNSFWPWGIKIRRWIPRSRFNYMKWTSD